ncbi:UNKNOWN [Stylonychia lemnae]|uniref:Uncharacterized protein n=1 Tax=Stylonychia lemnae TaxID=5949 RepID=A0A078APJ2_STYLE|nr:UNKNOWN [Stylonychia lemnae]|eukprot:CDW83232.1 UNKNOWN [Stylonychia lemnae]
MAIHQLSTQTIKALLTSALNKLNVHGNKNAEVVCYLSRKIIERDNIGRMFNKVNQLKVNVDNEEQKTSSNKSINQEDTEVHVITSFASKNALQKLQQDKFYHPKLKQHILNRQSRSFMSINQVDQKTQFKKKNTNKDYQLGEQMSYYRELRENLHQQEKMKAQLHHSFNQPQLEPRPKNGDFASLIERESPPPCYYEWDKSLDRLQQSQSNMKLKFDKASRNLLNDSLNQNEISLPSIKMNQDNSYNDLSRFKKAKGLLDFSKSPLRDNVSFMKDLSKHLNDRRIKNEQRIMEREQKKILQLSINENQPFINQNSLANSSKNQTPLQHKTKDMNKLVTKLDDSFQNSRNIKSQMKSFLAHTYNLTEINLKKQHLKRVQ